MKLLDQIDVDFGNIEMIDLFCLLYYYVFVDMVDEIVDIVSMITLNTVHALFLADQIDLDSARFVHNIAFVVFAAVDLFEFGL